MNELNQISKGIRENGPKKHLETKYCIYIYIYIHKRLWDEVFKVVDYYKEMF